MPHAVLEAMSFELPVIVSTGCGSVELIENGVNGLVVPPNDSEKLAAALLLLLTEEPLQQKIGCAGAATVRSNCYWPDVANRVAANLEQVVEAYRCKSG
jgi:glycosyltransferase involved in cell wall biosynthesis